MGNTGWIQSFRLLLRNYGISNQEFFCPRLGLLSFRRFWYWYQSCLTHYRRTIVYSA
jgi:hypothetical protein